MNINCIFCVIIGILFHQLNLYAASDTPGAPAASDADKPAVTASADKDFNAVEFVDPFDPDGIVETKLPTIYAELIETIIKLHQIVIFYIDANKVSAVQEQLIREQLKQFLTEFVSKFIDEMLDEIEKRTPEEIDKFEETYTSNTLPCNEFDHIKDLVGIYHELKKIYLPLSAHFECQDLP